MVIEQTPKRIPETPYSVRIIVSEFKGKGRSYYTTVGYTVDENGDRIAGNKKISRRVNNEAMIPLKKNEVYKAVVAQQVPKNLPKPNEKSDASTNSPVKEAFDEVTQNPTLYFPNWGESSRKGR